MRTADDMRRMGQEIGDYIERRGLEEGLEPEEMLTLILSICYGWAAYTKPDQDPRPLFEKAAKVWDQIRKTQRVQIVNEIPHDFRDMGGPPGFHR